MRDILAERLLAKVMEWGIEDVARERPDLQALAAFKYDEYQQFSPGMRFLESLAVWLNQFVSREERELAYEFVRSRLIFISAAEMTNLVSIAFPDFIRPLLIHQTANLLNVPERDVKKIVSSSEFKVLLRQSLFLGLSDGADIGTFRRCNPQISNEQVRLSHEIPSQRIDAMVTELHSDLKDLLGREPHENERKFKVVFLLDDFSGSGLSYLRRNPDGTYGGKITKILREILEHNPSATNPLRASVDSDNLRIGIVLYVATTRAKQHLDRIMGEWIGENGAGIKHNVLVVQEIPDEVCVRPDSDNRLADLLTTYFDESIKDWHYEVGKCERPYLGFDECALPVILSHNTPNNSIPLLWYDETKKYKGLFPRVSRHR